jgi:hypothetical protein
MVDQAPVLGPGRPPAVGAHMLAQPFIQRLAGVAQVVTVQDGGMKDVELHNRSEKQKAALRENGLLVSASRGDWIRTSDHLHPMQVRYRAALHPEELVPHFAGLPATRRSGQQGCVKPVRAANVEKGVIEREHPEREFAGTPLNGPQPAEHEDLMRTVHRTSAMLNDLRSVRGCSRSRT